MDPLSKTIVIHPGSRWLRIGRASDAFPLAIPNVIARKRRGFVPGPDAKGKQCEDSTPAPTPPPPTVAVHYNPPEQQDMDIDQLDEDDDVDDKPPTDPATPADPLSAKISSIRADLRARMRAFNLRGQGNGNTQAIAYNETVTPEAVAEHSDPGEIEWTVTEGPDAQEVYVGQKVTTRAISFELAADRVAISTGTADTRRRSGGLPRAPTLRSRRIQHDRLHVAARATGRH